MLQSKAPYGEVPDSLAKERAVFDRQNFRLIGRMWEQYNARAGALMERLWQRFLEDESQGWLPLGDFGIDRWFVRAVNASVWMVATNNGRSIFEKLQRSGTPAQVDAVTSWFEEHEPDTVNWVVHECTAACREPYYHIWYGYGTYCQTDLSVSPESARVFYLTMAWLLEEEGSYFITRYATAVNRLYTLRRVASNNNRRCAELRRAQLKASQ